MHPFSILTLGIFVAGYITARWDLVTRLYELAIFAWDHGVVVRFPGHECPRLAARPWRETAHHCYFTDISFARGADSDFERVSLPLCVLLPLGIAHQPPGI